MSSIDRRLVVRAAFVAGVVSVATFVSVRLAIAVPGGETRPALSFSGTLTGASGPQTLRFVFQRPMVTTPVCEGSATVNPGSAGQFTASIPIDACPATLFDGSDVVFDVAVGGTPIATDQAINPVPYARYADRVGTPDCPVGYSRDSSAMGIVLCRRPLAGGAFDEVVRVGAGASAFWIDRYEASVWQNADGSGSAYGSAGEDYPMSFPANGQSTLTQRLYALSRSGVAPSGWITWFRAAEACMASGKRLPRPEEWQVAATGTADPGASDGSQGRCWTAGCVTVRRTGLGAGCVSNWGAQDMVGNAEEMTANWVWAPAVRSSSVATWPSGFGGDGFLSIASTSWVAGNEPNAPAVVARGGRCTDGESAGVFSVSSYWHPASSYPTVGFRCVIPR